jgi:hypothetical protein
VCNHVHQCGRQLGRGDVEAPVRGKQCGEQGAAIGLPRAPMTAKEGAGYKQYRRLARRNNTKTAPDRRRLHHRPHRLQQPPRRWTRRTGRRRPPLPTSRQLVAGQRPPGLGRCALRRPPGVVRENRESKDMCWRPSFVQDNESAKCPVQGECASPSRMPFDVGFGLQLEHIMYSMHTRATGRVLEAHRALAQVMM